MYHVDIAYKDEYLFEVTSGNYKFAVDAKAAGGITPPDMLLASLGTCIGVYIHKYAQGAKLDIKDFAISVDAEFSKEPPVRFRDIKVSVDLKRAPLDERRKKSLLEFIKNCPVHNSLAASPAVEIKLV